MPNKRRADRVRKPDTKKRVELKPLVTAEADYSWLGEREEGEMTDERITEMAEYYADQQQDR